MSAITSRPIPPPPIAIRGPHRSLHVRAMLMLAESQPWLSVNPRRLILRSDKAVYCIAVGGAAYLVSKAIRKSRVLAFEDLGMEAIYEFEVKDMPVTVAVDAEGTSVHNTAPAQWSEKIRTLGIPVRVA